MLAGVVLAEADFARVEVVGADHAKNADGIDAVAAYVTAVVVGPLEVEGSSHARLTTILHEEALAA